MQPPVYHADAVIALDDPDGALLQLSVVEVQLACDADKRFSRPLYVAGQRARLRVPVDLVIVASAPEVARWCQEPIPPLHGQEQDAEVIALAALVGCSTLDRERATRYADLVMASLSEAARKALEVFMAEHKLQYESEFARKYFDQGLQAGALTERRLMLRRLLERRFGPVPADVLARVEAAEVDQLARWLDRLLDEPPSLDAVFDER